jgi:hypothetical protein
MKFATYTLTLALLGALSLIGCSSSDDSSAVAPPAPTEGMPGMGAPGMGTPGVGGGTSTVAGGGGAPGPRKTSFDGAPEAMKKLFAAGGGGGGMSGGMGGGATAGAKPSPIREGMTALASRKDPFESVFKPVVQITPAWDYVMNHRTQAPYVPVEVPRVINPDLDLPPLTPIPRRVAGVFYNGGIVAIIESGIPPDADIDIVQPGGEVKSRIPGVPDLVVESISMENLILRARDGRSVEVKLSGLSPAVRNALSQQFNQNAGTGGMGNMGSGAPGMGGPGMGAPGSGGKGSGSDLQ